TLTKKGASFEAQVEDFLVGDGSGDFRPIDLCFSPDGEHMYVADWNFAGGGKAEKVGRLFRVTYVGDDVRREPHRAKDADPLEAQIRSLGHPSHHERMRAQQRLAAMGKAAVGPVSQLLASDARALANVHAIWTQNALMDELEGYDPVPEWIAALRASDADVRGQAARALGNRRVKRASAKLAESLKDRDAAVRMQAAVALGRIGQASSAKPLYESLGEQDVVTRFTMTQAIRAIGNWQPALGHLRTADKKMRQTIIQTLAGIFDAGAVDVLNQWFREADDPAERVAALQALAKVHRKAAPYTGGWWGGKAAGGKPARPQEHPWTATAVVLEAIDAGLQHGLPQVRLAALEALREVPAPEILPQVRRMVDDDPDQDVRLQAIRILARLKDATSVPPPSRLATNKETSNPSRQEAIRAVVDTDAKPDDKQLAEIAVAEESPIPLVAKLEPAAYAQYAIDHRGDPRRGQKLFADTEGIGCVKCHVVGGAGAANIGPDLLGVGAKYPRRELIRSVLEPSNRILTDFEMMIVITTDGVIHQGMIRSQTPERTELV
ncbi:MAG: HEAT repeat domain-containing protein, partial [Pirellulales bacterium]